MKMIPHAIRCVRDQSTIQYTLSMIAIVGTLVIGTLSYNLKTAGAGENPITAIANTVTSIKTTSEDRFSHTDPAPVGQNAVPVPDPSLDPSSAPDADPTPTPTPTVTASGS